MKNPEVIVFPVKNRESIFIKEFDRQIFNLKVSSLCSDGYEVQVLNTSYKKTGFGGVVSYFAELKKAL